MCTHVYLYFTKPWICCFPTCHPLRVGVAFLMRELGGKSVKRPCVPKTFKVEKSSGMYSGRDLSGIFSVRGSEI